ncbi:hypothetical protein C8A05DRAFT_38971 [Staphylotrichum tortipilum]|uniref:Uncharacterized protein n=1 Tax=Staphylotrichum tortipilum TaxID=2831512 RepID=A0AAN6MB34_9PEZI|nr:hypothetical protein C8A05DRAFT_38971 [Staphylotrichum longicolle]
MTPFLAVSQTDEAIIEALGGLPLSSFVNETDGTTAPFFSTVIAGRAAVFDLSDPSRLQFCDLTNGNCFSLRANGLHIFPSTGGEAIITYDSPPPTAPSRIKRTADLVQRVVLPTRTPDRTFTAFAGFVDRCGTALTTLNDPFPEFAFDTVPCTNSHVAGEANVYQGVCKYVTAMEFGCRDTAKAIIDHSIGSDSIFKDLDVIGKYLGGLAGVQWLIGRLAAFLAALGIETAIAAGATLAVGAEFVFAAILFAAAMRQVVDVVGSQNIAILWCESSMIQCEPCFLSMRGPHDVTVKALGEKFTIATLPDFPESFIARAEPFVIKGYTTNTKRQDGGSCSIPDNLVRNGGFEDDGAVVPWPNGRGWWLPVAPTDPTAFARWDGWQVTTMTNPQASIVETGCLKGARCLQAYAVASPSGSGGTRLYQLLPLKFTPGGSYTFSFSYSITQLSSSTGVLGGSNYCYLFSHFQFSDVGQPGFMRLQTPVGVGEGTWQRVTRGFTYQASDPRASSEEFTLEVACFAAAGVTVGLQVVLDELSVVAA